MSLIKLKQDGQDSGTLDIGNVVARYACNDLNTGFVPGVDRNLAAPAPIMTSEPKPSLS